MSEHCIRADGLGKTFPLAHPPLTLFQHLARASRRQNTAPLNALTDVNFHVTRGEWIGIVGNNGSGKTTLLKLIAGLYPPSHGTLEVEGNVTLLSGLGVGMVATLSVRENIFLYGALCGILRRPLEQQLDEILQWAELEKFEHAKFQTLSSGMRSRLAFSIARHATNPIHLQDEALTAGDKDFAQKCYQYYESVRNSERTFLMAAHDLNFVERFCTRTLWLAQGRQIAFGDTAQVLQEYRRHHS